MKKIKKIIFIESRSPDFHIFSRTALPRLGTILLGTILKNAGYDVKSYVETVEDLDLEDALSADLVGISSITSTTPRSYEIAKVLQKSGVPVFMGGPHVTYMTEEALEHCDYVIRGEADDIIVDFVKTLEAGKGFENIPGLSFKKDGAIVHNRTVASCKDVNTLPIPDFSIVHGLEQEANKKLSLTPIMTSRGCPYDCSFCSVTQMFGQKYRFRSMEKVMEELEYQLKRGTEWVFFYDDNFTANRQRTKELLTEMIKRGLTPKWTAQVRVETAKDAELIDLMKRAGCHTVYIGFESVNPETLKAYNKKQSVGDIEHCIKILHKNGIRIHGMFVFGSDMDDVSTIHETVRFAKKNDLESIQFMILTPLPGTRLHHELDKDGRIFSKDWSIYDAHHVVYSPKKMSYFELQSETMQAYKDFYTLWQITKRLVRMDIHNVAIKAYGRNLIRKWISKNQYFIDYTHSITKAGRAIEIAAKKSADDIKEKFHRIELARLGSTQPKTKESF
ncbi:MAG: B12-binding domain-containing radical SAM protein [Deltaproteobacteria bacterium]|nr:B12-binding domain-containing radical SAM protein [Deltaproteobacteria bacterium]